MSAKTGHLERLMHPLFPNALIACVRDGRLPQAAEVEELSGRWSRSDLFAAFQPAQVTTMAQLALGGCGALAIPSA